MPERPSVGTRVARLTGLIRIGASRVFTKARHTDTRRVGVSVGGIALAIALTLVVTGVALGLSSQAGVDSDDVDYWIVPERGTASTMVVSTNGPQFGQVHSTSKRLAAHSEIRSATPVLVELIQLSTPSGTEEFILAIGVIPQPGISIAGMSGDGLTAGDSHFDNGTYNGTWTGEAVLSTAAAELLSATNGTHLTVTSSGRENAGFTVTGVETGESTGFGQVPIALVHLGELQALSGADSGDQADQILVSTNAQGVKPMLETVYPKSIVVAKNGVGSRVPSSGLPLAMSITAGVVGLVVGTLFITTTMGLELAADSRVYGVLGAIGLSWRSRAVIVLVQTLLVTALGGLLGVLLGAAGIAVVNAIASESIVSTTVATFHPLLVAYGLGISLLVGLLALPYLLWLTKRRTVLEQLTR